VLRATAALTVTAALLTACGSGEPATSPQPPATAPTTSQNNGESAPETTASTPSPSGTGTSTGSTPAENEDEVLEPTLEGTVVEGLEAPWGLAFLPDGGALVSERDNARIVRMGTDGSVMPVGEVPRVAPRGEGGLLGIALSPDFERDRLVYAYLTSERDNRVVRMTYDSQGALGAPEVVIEGIPAASVHNGGRIVFGPDDLLYVATGDSSESGLSQDVGSLAGKILRLTPDGEPAPGNPFDGSPVYSLGHRNVQGLAFDSTGQLWASEFGQNTFDELNRIEAGSNYGWPVVEGTGEGEEFIDPVVVWTTDEASPSGIAIAGSAVWLAALQGERLWQVPLLGGADREVGEPVDYLTDELGRLRHVAQAPDGSLWVLTNNTDGRGDPRPGDDRIVRITLFEA
jgi:glucose/arabinose dehydrogenase